MKINCVTGVGYNKSIKSGKTNKSNVGFGKFYDLGTRFEMRDSIMENHNNGFKTGAEKQAFFLLLEKTKKYTVGTTNEEKIVAIKKTPFWKRTTTVYDLSDKKAQVSFFKKLLSEELAQSDNDAQLSLQRMINEEKRQQEEDELYRKLEAYR